MRGTREGRRGRERERKREREREREKRERTQNFAEQREGCLVI